MTNDILLIIGIGIAALAIPAIIGAFSEGRTPRAAAIMIMIGGGLVVTAVTQQPGGYTLNEVPDVFVRVVGHILR
ncbi:MAG: hypothetical protein ACRBBK_13445 [Paracoccaceae bacterium]